MSGWRSWFSPSSARSKSPAIPEPHSNLDWGSRKVLHGRVTKTVPTKALSTSNNKKYQAFVEEAEDSDKHEGTTSGTPLGLTTTAEPTDGMNDEEYDHKQKEKKVVIKKEEAEEAREEDDGDGEEEDYWEVVYEEDEGGQEEDEGGEEDEGEDDQDHTSKVALAMVAQAVNASSKSHTEAKLMPTDSDNSSKDGSDSESDLDSSWRWEQIYLNTILNARNEFTLMPSTWRMHFRGIPLPDSLFYIKSKSKSVRPKIYARTDKLEYRGAVALRKLVGVHARIQDIRNDEIAVKFDDKKSQTEKSNLLRGTAVDMAKQLRRALEQALDWAKNDGGIVNYEDTLPPNVRIIDIKLSPQQPDSEYKIQTEMCDLAQQWRDYDSKADEPTQVPVIFGFVIMKHIITIVTMDASDPDAIIHIPCQLHMAERNQHQWNALAILVTVCWARDVLLEYISARPGLKPIVKSESSDPDA